MPTLHISKDYFWLAEKIIKWLGFLRFCSPNPYNKFELLPFMPMSRDQNSFVPVNPQGSIFTLRQVVWFGLSVQQYIECFQYHTLRAFSQKF